LLQAAVVGVAVVVVDVEAEVALAAAVAAREAAVLVALDRRAEDPLADHRHSAALPRRRDLPRRRALLPRDRPPRDHR
jgi:hypothetical protein